ncbi:SufE family protein [Salibacteraceae bacterium]|jgi:cysteine desulfuration protein SufE|nr:SufE family protein [Salibacteraceae bacterium]
METIEQKQKEIIEEFALFEDWMGKYEFIIDLSKDLESMDDSLKDEDHLVRGCQSQVWLEAKTEDGLIHFQADSDALITKGLIAMLVRVLSGQKANDIATSDLFFIDEIGLHEHLSPNRSNGLASMVKKMKTYAIAYSAS